MSTDKKLQNDHILELVKKIQLRDQAAFAELYDEFSQRIYAFIRIKVPAEEIAEDILQKVFLKAWRGCVNLKTDDLNFSAWLYKIASNTVNDYYRKTYREPQTTPLEEVSELADQSNYTDKPEANLPNKVISQTLNQLPQNYKEVIELRYFQDFSVADTAKILGKNSVTVRVWQHRAIKQLEILFKKYGQSSQEIL